MVLLWGLTLLRWVVLLLVDSELAALADLKLDRLEAHPRHH